MTSDRTDPLYRPEAMLVASVLCQPSQYENVNWVQSTYLNSVATQDVWICVQHVMEREKITDPDTLTTKVRALLVQYKKPDAIHRLAALTDTYPAVGYLAETYARAVLETRQRQDIANAMMKMTQIIGSDRPLDEILEMTEQTWSSALEFAHAQPGWKPIDGLASVPEFMEGSDTEFEWVIPGLLERQERLMVVAPEKAGKSHLTRQVALLLAAGKHPLNHREPVEPMTTLIVDLENPAAVARRGFRRQVAAMDGLFTAVNGDRAHIWHRPAGLHLGDRTDRLMLHQAIERTQPDLLCICPVYKAYDGLERSWEEQAFGVQKPLDQIRDEFNCAIWLEHHAPWKAAQAAIREYRPLGSSRWSRWLDYQVALVGAGEPPYQRLEWKAVRRDERKMCPDALRRGSFGEPAWIPVWAEGEDGFTVQMSEAMY